ncbi:MAG: hypothetical protein A07HR60_02330 [uncultured archaeon A07HR60]|nr:MAG: hypothetical protein A07HR60_02330 [uncultured archaeon A07HR60]
MTGSEPGKSAVPHLLAVKLNYLGVTLVPEASRFNCRPASRTNTTGSVGLSQTEVCWWVGITTTRTLTSPMLPSQRRPLERCLTDAYLRGAALYGSNLSNADLSRAGLIDADLTDADLSHAALWDARLFNADLSEAILAGAVLFDADFSPDVATDPAIPEDWGRDPVGQGRTELSCCGVHPDQPRSRVKTGQELLFLLRGHRRCGVCQM